MTAIPLDRAAFLRPIAHRGLHNPQTGIVENSLPAFNAAIARGYGIECDLRPARDGTPMVFHDTTLERLTSRTGGVDSAPADELQGLQLRGCRLGSTIPTFADALALIRGAVPTLVEVKTDWTDPDPRFIDGIGACVHGYAGPLALMSFDPALISALARCLPQVPRGLVTGAFVNVDGAPSWPAHLDGHRREQLAGLADFDRVGASFIAHDALALPAPAVSHRRAAGTPIFAWTIRSAADWVYARQYADAPIFEGWLPSPTSSLFETE